MSKITGLIGTQAYELIRVKIGSIIAEELANQVVLGGDYSIDADVYVERDVPFDRIELPAINIALPSGNYDNKHQGSSRGVYTFNIECYMGAKSSNDTMGDVRANVKLQKLVGIVRAILENPVYKFLDFPPPFISKTTVTGFQNGKVNNGDGGFNVVSIISFEVVCNEVTELLEGIDFDSMCTVMKLHLTKNGYLFCSGEHTPIPPVNPCSDGRIFINGEEEFSVESGGVINILLEDLSGLPIIPTSIYGNVITIDNTGGACLPVTYQILRDGELYESGSEPSGGNIVVNVPSDCPPPPECDPLEITFGGYPLMTVPEPCGELVELSCDTLTIHTYVDDGAEVTGVYYFEQISGDYVRDENHYIFYNGTAWELEKTGGNITAANGSEEYPWQADWSGHGGLTVTQATIGQTCGSDVVCDDATITLNGDDFITVPSGSTEDISLIDERGNDIVPTDVTGNVIEVYTGGDTRLPKTGADTATISGDDGTSQRGRGTSFFLLDTNNPFGHLRRFTGKTGGYHDGTNYKDVNGTNTTEALAFPDSVILDWMDRTETDVKAYRYTFVIGDANTVIPAQPYTHDTHSDWYLANLNEVFNLGRKKGDVGVWYTWRPLNHTITSTATTRIASSTPNGGNNYFEFGLTSMSSTLARNQARNWYLTRRYTLSSLGL